MKDMKTIQSLIIIIHITIFFKIIVSDIFIAPRTNSKYIKMPFFIML